MRTAISGLKCSRVGSSFGGACCAGAWPSIKGAQQKKELRNTTIRCFVRTNTIPSGKTRRVHAKCRSQSITAQDPRVCVFRDSYCMTRETAFRHPPGLKCASTMRECPFCGTRYGHRRAQHRGPATQVCASVLTDGRGSLLQTGTECEVKGEDAPLMGSFTPVCSEEVE